MNDIGELLRFDPLAQAERITGNEYKTDDETAHLGMGIALLHNQRKNAALAASDDSHYGITFDGMVALMGRLGFDVVLTRTFAGRDAAETSLVLWHPDGILGTLESYHGDHLNTAKVYYNVRPHDEFLPWSVTSSGQHRLGVWAGDHDAREGIRYNLDALREHGDFLSPWVARPWLWFLNYTDTDGDYDHKAINESVIAQLPEHVIAAITPAVSA
jgi:hypothetical protein